ncbi:MAG: hypothetical protein JF606_06195 [Burkholderiales bacterium]|nr:hypothetical protein [Burkholderiales bacterium]
MIPPDQIEVYKQRVLGEVYQEEKNEPRVDAFLAGQRFWNDYLQEYHRSALLSWNAKYPRHF